MTDWDKRFINLASYIALWSKDPGTKCGAVIVRPDRTIASMGFNGFPQRVADVKLDDRGYKLERVIHAEMNAVLFLRERPSGGYTLYTWPMLPCNRCAVHVIQAGIARVVAPLYKGERWAPAIKITKELLNEAQLQILEIGTDGVVDAPLINNGARGMSSTGTLIDGT